MTKPGRLSLAAIVLAALVLVAVFSFNEPESVAVDATSVSDLHPLATIMANGRKEHVDNNADPAKIIEEALPTPGCEEFRTSEPFIGVNDRISEQIPKAIDLLAQQNNAELVLAAALLESDAVAREQSLAKAYQLDPGSPLTMWHRIQACIAVDCDEQVLLDLAVEVDSDNAALWLERASGPLQVGNWGRAEVELRRGASASRFDIYFAEHVALVERALAASTELGYMERMVAAIGSAAAVAIPNYSDLSLACQKETNDPAVWGPLCDDFGAVMVAGSQTVIDQMIGLALRRIAAQRQGNERQVAEFARLEDEVRQLIDEMTRTGVHTVLMNDQAFMVRYWDRLTTYGELDAMKFSVEEARRLRADSTYDQCNFVARPWPET